MSYIVLDLEWNQCPKGKEFENKKMPFEIIEIGAVKLNEKYEIEDEFDQIIRPQLYTKLHYVVKELIDVSADELQSGMKFGDAARQFLDWCGDEPTFCTWGSGDLTEFQRNMEFFGLENPFPMPFKFFDIQKFYSILYEDGKIRRSLQYVIEQMNLSEDEGFHRAINDARYTAKIMQIIDIGKVKGYYSIDCYRIPHRRAQEIHAVYDTYEKVISKGYRTREGAVEANIRRECKCYVCGRVCKALIPWFSTNSKVYYGLYKCEKHGYIKTRMRAKQADNDKYFVTKIIKITDEEGAKNIERKQEIIREKRKEKRHHADGESNS